MRRQDGFTLLETIVAIAVLGIVLAALAGVTVSSLGQTRNGSLRAQATQVLDTVGRRVIGGADASLLPASGSTVVFDYGEASSIVDLGGNDSDLYRVTITHAGSVTVGDTTTLQRYRVAVCFRGTGDEQCLNGTTLARSGG